MSVLYTAYQKFQKTARYLGLDIAIKKTIRKVKGHESIFPYASYAPRLLDNEFIKAYGIIKDYTLVDKYRCFELWELLEETVKVKGSIIEIGVRRGGTGALIAKKASILNITDKVYLCDTFTGVVKAGDSDTKYSGGEHADTSIDIAREVIKKMNVNNVQILQGIFPEESSHFIDGSEKFRFCHIDVDVYQSAKDIVDWIWSKMDIGAIIVFDDYGFITCSGITDFVNEQRMKADKAVIHNLNGHAIIIKLA